MTRHIANPRTPAVAAVPRIAELEPEVPPERTPRLASIWHLARQLRWRLLFVALFCLVLATEMLAQPGIYEFWSFTATASGFLDYFVQCAGYGFAILIAVAGAERLLPRLPGLAWPIALGLAIVVGTLGGGLLDVWIHGLGVDYVRSTRFLGEALRWTVTAAVVVSVYALQSRAAASVAAVHAGEIERVALDRQVLEARLQVMRAQIEPHFLFNTLANVKRLCQSDVGRGLTMLENLVRYLRAALPQLREETTTLGQEVDLVQAYLDVLQVRMGAFMGYSLDVPPVLRELPFPPMVLLTLVENAIKHGLAPSPGPGRIDIVARRKRGALVVTVADTGVGFGAAKTGGTGIGLANSRARLTALYGPDAALDLASNEPSGVVATIRLPLSAAATVSTVGARGA